MDAYNDELVYWLWLSRGCTPDSATFPKLIEAFGGDAKTVYEASDRELRQVLGSRSSDCTRLCNKDLNEAMSLVNFCKTHGVGILHYGLDSYPLSLGEIKTPPVLLYYRGALPDFNKMTGIAVVGTRSLTEYGKKNAFNISYDLARSGATVISGMARGIDGVALAGAIAAGGKTVAVIGSGIDVPYPPEHLTLAREIVKQGCVLTEFPPKTKPDRFNFPKRNRIISALACATFVVEGEERSGSLITARCAKEQGKTVFALPGNVGNAKSLATNLLIKNGAKLCSCAEDIISEVESKTPGSLNAFLLSDRKAVDMNCVLSELKVSALCKDDALFSSKRARKSADKPTKNKKEETEPKKKTFSGTEGLVYLKIPIDTDCLIEELVGEECDLRTVMKTLLKLEMGGHVEILPGERVRRS